MIKETSSSLYLFSGDIELATKKFCNLLVTSDKFRKNLSRHILSTTENKVLEKLLDTIILESKAIEKLFKILNISFINYYCDRKEFKNICEIIIKTRREISGLLQVKVDNINIDNIDKATKIIFTNSNDNRLNYLSMLYELISSIRNDCGEKREKIEIPINNLIRIINELTKDLKLDRIELLDGNYNATITTNSDGMILNNLSGMLSRHILPTSNANLDSFNKNELLEIINYITTANDNSLYDLLKKAYSRLTEIS